MTPEDDPQLWELLGKSREPELSPFFARNILREIRQQPTWRDRVRRWLVHGKLAPISGAVALLIVVAVANRPVVKHSKIEAETSISASENDDELLMDLDDVVAGDDSISPVGPVDKSIQ